MAGITGGGMRKRKRKPSWSITRDPGARRERAVRDPVENSPYNWSVKVGAIIDTTAVRGVAGLLTTLGGSLGASYVAARAQRELRRAEELGHLVDSTALQLAAAEAAGREAWRKLLELDTRGDAAFDDVLVELPASQAFPQERDPDAAKAVEAFASEVEALQLAATRLELRLGGDNPAAAALEAAREHWGNVATTMSFGAAGVVGVGGDDLADSIAQFALGVAQHRKFVAAARRLAALSRQ